MQPILTAAEFQKKMKEPPADGAFLLFGEEDYLKVHALRTAREVYCPDASLAVFNDIRLDALDFTASKLKDALLPPPMMEDRKIVTLTGLDFTTMRAGECEELCRVLETPGIFTGNVFILSVGAGAMDEGYLPKRPSALLSRLGSVLTPVRFVRTTPAKLVGWVARHMEHNGVSAPEPVCRKLIDYCGHDMFTLAAETDKLSFYTLAHGRKVADIADVERVACAVSEYDAFAFAGAVMGGRYDEALSILRFQKFRRTDPIVVQSEITGVFCDMLSLKALLAGGAPLQHAAATLKMHEYKAGLYAKAAASLSFDRLTRAIDLCAEADMALKSSSQGYAPIENLICTL